MKFIQHYSGSSGNLYEVIADNGKRLLLDPGVSWKMIQKALGYDLKNIVGCLVTHEHLDHCKGVPELLKAGIDIWANEGTFKSGKMNIVPDRKCHYINTSTNKRYWYDIDDTFMILGLSSNHDAVDPLFYVIKADDEYLLFAPDTAFIKQRFKFPFSIIAIECSYDNYMLQLRVDTEDINESLAKRLLNSHMEKTVAMDYIAKYCDLSKCSQIHLLHMSNDNIDKELTRAEFEQRFFIKTIICKKRK